MGKVECRVGDTWGALASYEVPSREEKVDAKVCGLTCGGVGLPGQQALLYARAVLDTVQTSGFAWNTLYTGRPPVKPNRNKPPALSGYQLMCPCETNLSQGVSLVVFPF